LRKHKQMLKKKGKKYRKCGKTIIYGKFLYPYTIDILNQWPLFGRRKEEYFKGNNMGGLR